MRLNCVTIRPRVVFPASTARRDGIISVRSSNRRLRSHSVGRRKPRSASLTQTSAGDITCFPTPQLCMLSSSSHTSLSIPFPCIQRRSVWDLCALNNAVLKGQEGDRERVNALARRRRWWGGRGGVWSREGDVNFQVSSNNEMHTVNVKQQQSTSNPPQQGNNGWISLRPQQTPSNGKISMRVNSF